MREEILEKLEAKEQKAKLDRKAKPAPPEKQENPDPEVFRVREALKH